MRGFNRRSTPGVKAGRVQKKNNWDWTPQYFSAEQPRPVIDRKRPGKGYRHLLGRDDIHAFIALLPDWPELSRGLGAIVLDPGDPELYGWHLPGVVALCAWDRELFTVLSKRMYEAEGDIFDRLEVEREEVEEGVLLKWTEPKARAYQLLRVLLHELGHHHDRMTTRSRRRASRGENFAETYARQYEAQIWSSYLETFDPF
jgi:hypothetical protein